MSFRIGLIEINQIGLTTKIPVTGPLTLRLAYTSGGGASVIFTPHNAKVVVMQIG